MTAPKITLTQAGTAGFDAAAVRVLRRRQPGARWRSLRDEANAPSERRPPAGNDDGGKRAA